MEAQQGEENSKKVGRSERDKVGGHPSTQWKQLRGPRVGKPSEHRVGPWSGEDLPEEAKCRLNPKGE